MSLAIFGKKTFWSFLILLTLVWIPYGMSKLKIVNAYTKLLIDPFVVFVVLIFILSIYLYQFFKPTWISLAILAMMILADFTYVYVFYIM